MKKLIIAAAFMSALLISCKEETPQERIQNGLEEIREGVEDGAEDLGDAIEDGAEEITDDSEDKKKKLKDLFKNND